MDQDSKSNDSVEQNPNLERRLPGDYDADYEKKHQLYKLKIEQQKIVTSAVYESEPESESKFHEALFERKYQISPGGIYFVIGIVLIILIWCAIAMYS